MARCRTRRKSKTALRGGCVCASCPVEFMQLNDFFLLARQTTMKDRTQSMYLNCVCSEVFTVIIVRTRLLKLSSLTRTPSISLAKELAPATSSY